MYVRMFTVTENCMHVHVFLTSTGNLGSHLTNSVSVYITRDGGLTWDKVNDTLFYCISVKKLILMVIKPDLD